MLQRAQRAVGTIPQRSPRSVGTILQRSQPRAVITMLQRAARTVFTIEPRAQRAVFTIMQRAPRAVATIMQPHLVASSHSLQPPASTSCRFRACTHIFGAVRYTSSDARDDSSSLAPMGTRFWHTPHPGARSIITPNAGSNTPAYSNLQSSTQRSTYKYADEKQHHFWVRKNSRPTPHVNDQANVITLPRQCDHKLHFA